MKTLIVNTHPDFENAEHFSHKLLTRFLEKYDALYSRSELEILNLYESYIPRIDKDMLAMWNAQRSGGEMTDRQKEIEARQNELLEQFKRCRRIVIVAPTHNFLVTSAMKDYMDNVLIARQTFKYTAEGSVGLMTDDYRALLLAASGSVYTNNDRYTPLEMQHFYLREMFSNIMGMKYFAIVRAQGTAVRPADEVLTDAFGQLEEKFSEFYA